MTNHLSGPLFSRASDTYRQSVYGMNGGHYNIFRIHEASEEPGADIGMAFLRAWFPNGEGDPMNLVFFSTSGVHGSYITIEQVEKGMKSYPSGIPDGDWPRPLSHQVRGALDRHLRGNHRKCPACSRGMKS